MTIHLQPSWAPEVGQRTVSPDPRGDFISGRRTEHPAEQGGAWILWVGALGEVAAAAWLITHHSDYQLLWLPFTGLSELPNLARAVLVGLVTITVLVLARSALAVHVTQPDEGTVVCSRRGSSQSLPIMPGDLDDPAVLDLHDEVVAVADLLPTLRGNTLDPSDMATGFRRMLNGTPGRLQIVLRGFPAARESRADAVTGSSLTMAGARKWEILLTRKHRVPLRRGGREAAAAAARQDLSDAVDLLGGGRVPASVLDGPALCGLVEALPDFGHPFLPGVPTIADPRVTPTGWGQGEDREPGPLGAAHQGRSMLVGATRIEVSSAPKATIVLGFPRVAEPGWLEPLLAYPGRIDIALHLEAPPSGGGSWRRWFRAPGIPHPESHRYLSAGLYLTVYAATATDLAFERAKILLLARGMGPTARLIRLRTVEGWASTLPLGLDFLWSRQRVDTAVLASALTVESTILRNAEPPAAPIALAHGLPGDERTRGHGRVTIAPARRAERISDHSRGAVPQPPRDCPAGG